MRLLVFSRRSLQQRLDALAGHLTADALRDLAARLDRRGTGRLPAMWEAVWLHALSQVGPIEHEQALPNGSKPDFRFQVTDSDGMLEVIGDITTVSDRGVHANNPIDMFWKEFQRYVQAARLNPNHFTCHIGHRTEGSWPDIRHVLLLPQRSQLVEFVKQQIAPVLRQWSATPAVNAVHSITTPDISITIKYDTSQQYAGGGHVSYNSFTSPTRNPIFNQLKLKENQLRSAPAESLRLVILCDGGCHSMKKMNYSANSLSSDEIVKQFLRKSTVIDLVLLISVDSKSINWYDRKLELQPRIVGAPAAEGSRRTVRAGGAVRDYLNRAITHLPTPTLDCHNASLRTDLPSPGTGVLGLRMRKQKIELSARVLLDLLAGKITTQEFQRIYGWGPDSERNEPNPFACKLECGQLITGARVSPGGDYDDDWFEFSFGGPDPAAAPFRSANKG